MDIAIIGNGPSYGQYIDTINSNRYDLKIGCNYPNPAIGSVDYSAFCDSFAARLMRKQAEHHDKLGQFKLILGKRAEAGLNTVKDQPAGQQTCLKYFRDEGIIEAVLPIPPECLEVHSQSNFTSGHLAYQYAAETYPDAMLHVFGMDSLFTQNHTASYSNVTIRHAEENATGETEPSKRWKDIWDVMFKIYPNDYLFYKPAGFDHEIGRITYDNTN